MTPSDTSETTAVTAEEQVHETRITTTEVQMDLKPGWRTSEFWLSLLVSILPWLTSHIPAQWAGALSALSVAAYTYSRGMAKNRAPVFEVQSNHAAAPPPADPK